jgi:hypothetical protein
MVVTPTCAFISQFNPSAPVLKKLDFSTMGIDTIKYDAPDKWWQIYTVTLGDLNNGDIVYGGDKVMLIIDNQTL